MIHTTYTHTHTRMGFIAVTACIFKYISFNSFKSLSHSTSDLKNSHLARGLDSLPQTEVKDDDDDSETGSELPARQAEVIDPRTVLKVQHTTPAAKHHHHLQ